MKDGRCIVRVSLDMLNVIIRRPRIVTVIYGYFICSEVFLSFLFPSSPLFSLFTRRTFSWRLVLEASRVENPLSSGSFILKIGGQWRVNLRENTRTVRDSRRSQATLGYSRWKVRELTAWCLFSSTSSPTVYNVSQTLFSEQEPLINFLT